MVNQIVKTGAVFEHLLSNISFILDILYIIYIVTFEVSY